MPRVPYGCLVDKLEACPDSGTLSRMSNSSETQPLPTSRHARIVKHAVCSACRASVPCTQQESYPDSGWVMPFDTFGYYGGFDDNVGVLTGSVRTREWILCHDCVVKFLDTFPLLAQDIGQNCHPDSRDTPVPCCRHAWQATDIFGKNIRGVHSRTAWPDGVWHDDPEENPYDTSRREDNAS